MHDRDVVGRIGLLGDEAKLAAAGAGGVEDVEPARDERCLQIPASVQRAEADHMRRHRHRRRLVVVDRAQIIVQPVDQSAAPDAVLLPCDHHLGLAAGEGVAILVPIELRAGLGGHRSGPGMLRHQHPDLALGGRGLPGFFGGLGLPVSKIEGDDILAPAEQHRVCGIAKVELGVIVGLELRVEGRAGGPDAAHGAIQRDLAERLSEARNRAWIRAIVRLADAWIDSGFGNLHGLTSNTKSLRPRPSTLALGRRRSERFNSPLRMSAAR